MMYIFWEENLSECVHKLCENEYEWTKSKSLIYI